MNKIVEQTKSKMAKKMVMVALILIAAFFVALYIGVLARPISYGMAYSGDVPLGAEVGMAANVKGNITMKSSKVMKIKAKMNLGEKVQLDKSTYL